MDIKSKIQHNAQLKQDSLDHLNSLQGSLESLVADLEVYKRQLTSTDLEPRDEASRAAEIAWVCRMSAPMIEVMGSMVSTALVMNSRLSDLMNNPGGPGSVGGGE